MLYKISQDKKRLIEQKKEKILQLIQKQNELITLFFNDDLLIIGSYIETKVKCGKKGCHCENKPIHQITKLSKWENKKLKNKIIRVNDRKWVKKCLVNYKTHKKALSDYEKLFKEIKAIMKDIINLKAIIYK
ncbi:MAG: DUF6788 family protein [Candidatus Odinarchaeota archaeon]